jgi:hypothetical protein
VPQQKVEVRLDRALPDHAGRPTSGLKSGEISRIAGHIRIQLGVPELFI